MNRHYFPPWPSYSQEEADKIQSVLLSNKVNYWTGKEGRLFEKEFAHSIGSEYAVAVANGTVALDLALKALGVGPGDEVIVTPRTFIASVSTIVNNGAIPVFADVDAQSQNSSASTIEPCITTRTKAIICVHLAGWPCDMDPIMRLAEEHNLFVIEDCAQAHGAKYKGKNVGSIGHIGAWSFCQDKIISTGGEGGMVTTNSRNWWSFMWSYKDHGKSWDLVYNEDHAPGFRWLHSQLGTNYRITEIQAAIGCIQLKRLSRWHKRRTSNARQLTEAFRTLKGLRVSEPPEEVLHAYYKYYCFVERSTLKEGWSRDRILNELVSRGIPVAVGSCSEVYLEKAFFEMQCVPKPRLPVAQKLGETSLLFLVHPTLGREHMNTIINAVGEVMELSVR